MTKQEAIQALSEYCGNNKYLLFLKSKNGELGSFDRSYIENSIDFEEKDIEKKYKLAEWYASSKMDEWGLPNPPKIILIHKIMGYTNDFYHINATYRRSIGPTNMFIPKNAILGDLLGVDYEKMEIDFDKYDEICKVKTIKLMEHQKKSVKFLLSKKKAILGNGMGAGKTVTLIVAALESQAKKILVICPASLKNKWRDEICFYANEDEVEVVNGKTWKENKFTIINYDILDNFYEIPQEQAYDTVTYVGKDGKEKKRRVPAFKETTTIDENTGEKVVVKVPKMVASKNRQLISESMEKSQLFQSHFDMVIIDECHNLSNNTSQRYKIISDLLRRLNPEYIFPVTGTLITNTPDNYFNVLKLIKCPITFNYDYYKEHFCGCEKTVKGGEWNRLYAIYSNMHGIKCPYTNLDRPEKEKYKKFFESNKKEIWIGSNPQNLDELMEATKDFYIRIDTAKLLTNIKKTTIPQYYTLSSEEKEEYNKFFEEWVNEKKKADDGYIPETPELTEMVILRQYIANKTVEKTIKTAEQHIERGEKVVIITNFDSELDKFVDHFKKKCVKFNGKMTSKAKDNSVTKFMTDDSVMVFVGNLRSCGVGINLDSSHVCILNSLSWVPADNYQAQDRIFRLSQKKDVTVYYEIIKDTISEDMYNRVIEKENLINTVIKDEDEK